MPSMPSCSPGRSRARRCSTCASRLYSTSTISDALPLPRDARDAHQLAQRNLDVDVLQVVLARAANHQRSCRCPRGASRALRSACGPTGRRRSATSCPSASAARVPSATTCRRARPRPDPGRSPSRPPAHGFVVVLHHQQRCCPGRACFCSVWIRRALSRWCRPIDGSSSTYSTPVSCEPICVASRMRCASPPESVAGRAVRVR